MRIQQLVEEAENLSTSEKWQLVEQLLQSLKQGSSPPQPDWHARLAATYGLLSDDPLERPEQLPLEERDPVE